jgi:hypothetical protein
MRTAVGVQAVAWAAVVLGAKVRVEAAMAAAWAAAVMGAVARAAAA